MEKIPKDESLLIDTAQPLQALSSEKRAMLAEFKRRSGRQRGALPKNWRNLMAAMYAERKFNASEAARALHMHRDTLNKIRREFTEFDDFIAKLDANLEQIIVSGIVKAAMAGDKQSAVWCAEHLWPEKYGPKPTSATQINVNAVPSVPGPLTADEYAKLLSAQDAPQ